MGFHGRTFGQVLKESALELLFGVKPDADGRQYADLPYASGVNGADRVMGKILGVEGVMNAALLDVLERSAPRVQMAMAQLVDKDTQHLRRMLMDDKAVYIDATNLVAYIGMRRELRAAYSNVTHPRRRKKPSRLHNEGIYAVWVNSGRAAYQAGQMRSAGTDKRGRVRQRKVARTTGAMPGSHFMERALEMYRPHIRQLREMALREAIHIKLGVGRRRQ